MGAPIQQRKILRIGIIQGGRIIEERLIPHGTNVSIGDGQKNTFVLHSSGLPKRFHLFTFKGSQYSLCFTGEMDGKLSMDGGVVMGFDGVRAKSVKQKDGTFAFPLSAEVRGKVSIAGTTILFQFVPAPPVTKRGRGDFGVPWHKQLDTTFLGIFASSFLIHAVVMLYSMSLPAPKPLTLEEVPDRFARLIAPKKPKPQPENTAGEGEKKSEEEEKQPEKKEVKEKKSDDKANADAEKKPTLTEAQRKEKRKQELKQVGILRVLGSKFNSNSNAAGIKGEDIFSIADGSAGLGDLINRKAKGIATASTAEQFGLRATSDTSLIGSGDVDGVETDTEVETAKRVAKKVPKANLDGDTDVFGNMNRTTLDGVIKKNLPSVTACYDRALKMNPNIQGKIYIEFTVVETGRISSVEVRGAAGTVMDKAMVDCIKGRVRRWKFPESEEGATDVSLPIVLTAS